MENSCSQAPSSTREGHVLEKHPLETKNHRKITTIPSFILDFSREILKNNVFVEKKIRPKNWFPHDNSGLLEKVYQTVGSGTSLAQCG